MKGKAPPAGRTALQQRMESAVSKGYGKPERPIRGHRSFNWVQRSDNRRWVHAYDDRGLIYMSVGRPLVDSLQKNTTKPYNIYDFCGGEGLVAEHLEPYFMVHDINAKIWNVDLSSRNTAQHIRRAMENRSWNTHAIIGDALTAELKRKPIDGAVIRFGLHYFSKAAQESILKRMFADMGPGACLVVYHPDHSSTQIPHVKAMAAASGMKYQERRKENYFPANEEVISMARQAGFVISAPTTVAEHWYSPASYADRWGKTPAERRRIEQKVEAIFEQAAGQNRYKGQFRKTRKGTLLKPGHHVVFVLRKP